MATKIMNLIKKLIVKTSNQATTQPTVTEQQDTMTVKSKLKAGYEEYLWGS